MVAVAVSSAACGGQPAQEDGSLSVADEALSDSCATAGTDASFEGFIDPAHISPRTYNRCTKSYIVNVNNLSDDYAGQGQFFPGRFEIRYADGLTDTAEGCADLEAGAIVFIKSGSTWVNISGHLTATGTWTGVFGCLPPQIDFSNIVAGQSYRVAATARLISGSNPTRKVSIATIAPE